MTKIAWTPPDSQWGLGSVLLPAQPEGRLTSQQYRLLLAQRINRLVRKAGLEAARDLLARYEDVEKLSLAREPRAAGELLAEYSEWLRQRAAFPPLGVEPPLKHSPETQEALEEETLEDFLALLYRDPDLT